MVRSIRSLRNHTSIRGMDPLQLATFLILKVSFMEDTLPDSGSSESI